MRVTPEGFELLRWGAGGRYDPELMWETGATWEASGGEWYWSVDLAETLQRKTWSAAGNQSPLKSKDSHHERPHPAKTHFSTDTWYLSFLKKGLKGLHVTSWINLHVIMIFFNLMWKTPQSRFAAFTSLWKISLRCLILLDCGFLYEVLVSDFSATSCKL